MKQFFDERSSTDLSKSEGKSDSNPKCPEMSNSHCSGGEPKIGPGVEPALDHTKLRRDVSVYLASHLEHTRGGRHRVVPEENAVRG
jgi:hypothetical protein